MGLSLGLVGMSACDSTGETEAGNAFFPCSNSQPIDANGSPGGFEICDEGFRHRPEVVTCSSILPRVTNSCAMDMTGGCTDDNECTDMANGYCGAGDFDGSCNCRYGCTTDVDCGDGMVCLCGDPVGACVQASCTSDADCSDGRLCIDYITEPGCGGTAFTCQTGDDECADDSDCKQGEQCTLAANRLVCQQIQCVIGRPFLVRGSERLAPAAAHADWCAELTPAVDAMSAELRAELRQRWTEIGLMEHASVAAFARFALQLLAVGAPPELLTRCQHAMADETEHAELAFALASAYGNKAVGPGPLAIDHALEAIDAVAILRLVVREGCIGETVAAIEAAETAAHAVDPVVRGVLTKITEDETRHAELAWRYVAWAVGRDATLAYIVREEIAAAIAEAPAHEAPDAREQELLTHGVASRSLRRAVRLRALRELVAPCAAALLTKDVFCLNTEQTPEGHFFGPQTVPDDTIEYA
jgi:hypothetical protein